jgi:hypothetical protein
MKYAINTLAGSLPDTAKDYFSVKAHLRSKLSEACRNQKIIDRV